MDARTLLEQMLGEETADLLERDYQVQTESLAESRPIQVDVQHLRRIFDNLFSNVLKYADPGPAGGPVLLLGGRRAPCVHFQLCPALRRGGVESSQNRTANL